MGKINGEQLYGLKNLAASLKMMSNESIKKLNLKQKLALNYVSKESKLTNLNGRIFSNTFTPYFPSLAHDRFLAGAVKTALGTPSPVVCNFAITSQCICNCWHCSFSDRDLKDGMSLDQLKQSIAEVQDLGASVIGITGGEPLLRDDLEDIIASIDSRSMPIMFTTGYKLTKQRVRKLKEAGLVIPVLSLDHYTAEVHDKGRGVKGIFEGTLKAIEMFKDEGFYVAVSFVPTKSLVDDKTDFFKTLEFFADLGVNDMRLTSPILSGKLTSKPEEKLSPENIQTIYAYQKIARKTKGYPNVFAYDFFESEKYYGCGAGYNYIFIDSQGNASPCDFTMLSLGNVKEQPIAAIWKKMSSRFRGPGCHCYANVIHETVAEMKSTTWPLSEAVSAEVLKQHPPFNPKEIPVYYQKIGFKSSEKKF
ncbi:MAG: radical SAM/SPASM domain-containing protein [Promethearchaeota archaeon]